jgi:hypothetical protein
MSLHVPTCQSEVQKQRYLPELMPASSAVDSCYPCGLRHVAGPRPVGSMSAEARAGEMHSKRRSASEMGLTWQNGVVGWINVQTARSGTGTKRKRLEPPQALLGVAKVDAHVEHGTHRAPASTKGRS